MFKKSKYGLTAAGIAIFVLFVLGFAAPEERSPQDDVRAERLEAYLSVLAADFTRGRETGSEGYDIAAEYAASLFKVWGLRPGGDVPDPLTRLRTGRARSYFQTVPLVRDAGLPETLLTLIITRNGFQKEVVFQSRTDFDVASELPFDVNAGIVFAGYGRTEPDFNELANLNFKDKFVVVLEGLPGQTNPSGALYKKNRQIIEARNERLRQAAAAGESSEALFDDSRRRLLQTLRDGDAAGCLILASPEEILLASSPPPLNAEWAVNAPFRNLASNALKMYEGDRPPDRRRRLRLTGGPVMAPAGTGELFRDPGDPVMISLSPSASDALMRQAGHDLAELRRRIDTTSRPASAPLAGATIRIRRTVRTEAVNGKNVIAVIPGSDPAMKNEVVVIGAHLDHIGAANQVIFNGADDNASGAAAVLELARAFAGSSPPPKRTIVFGLWCGEEDGFLGSRYFVQRPFAPLSDIVACLNLDMIGRLPRNPSPSDASFFVHTSCQTPLLERIARESCDQAGLKAGWVEDKIVGLTGSGGDRMDSDHVSFAARGIGFVYMETGIHEDWHSFVDHADKINFEGMEKIVRASYLTAKAISNLASRPVFDPARPAAKKPGRMKLILLEDKAPEGSSGAANPREGRTEVRDATALPAALKNKAEMQELRLTFDLLGKTDDSRFEGTLTVYAGDKKIFSTDTVMLRGFRDERVFSRECDVAGFDLAEVGLRWEIRGTLFDSALKETFTIARAESRKFSAPFRGIGFSLSTSGGKLEVVPTVY